MWLSDDDFVKSYQENLYALIRQPGSRLNISHVVDNNKMVPFQSSQEKAYKIKIEKPKNSPHWFRRKS